MQEKIDYSKINFKCGIEIHQQLDTHKLFCECPSILRSDTPKIEIIRKLHAVAGESGGVDEAAIYHSNLKKNFVYQCYDTTCLVEIDEEPPHKLNQEALKIAIQIALLLKCKIVKISQIMRKTVIDGSNTSGFQRTVLIATDGYIKTNYGKVRIDSIFLEEDSARIIERKGNQEIYRLDRLGIPLVEITTAPDIKTPEQAKETALQIGDVLRSCKVKRGIGTIRQDINMSIKDSSRIEIKGMQEMSIFIKTIENEIKRQLELMKKNEKIKSEVRNALPDGATEFLRPMPGPARMYPETDLPLLKIPKKLINTIKKQLPKTRKAIRNELKENGLNEEMIKLIIKNNKIEEYKELIEIYKKPELIVKMLLIYPKEIATKEKISEEIIREKINTEIIATLLEKIKKGDIPENSIKEILTKLSKGEEFEKVIKIEKVDLDELQNKIINLIKEKPGLTEQAYMGLIMKEYRGKVEGKQVLEIIKKLLK